MQVWWSLLVCDFNDRPTCLVLCWRSCTCQRLGPREGESLAVAMFRGACHFACQIDQKVAHQRVPQQE